MGLELLNIFIGYDQNESIAYHVLCQSIIEKTSVPVRITPIVKQQLDVYQRSQSEFESTDFSTTRFLTPYLSNYEGWSLFIDCDFVLLDDLKELWELRDENYAVMVCKHDYIPRSQRKFLDKIQSRYKMKNWSSLILFNNEKCKALTPDYINQSAGLSLHQFEWTKNELIGELPLNWNYLCDEDNQVHPPKGVHYTNGGPWFIETRDVEFANYWYEYRSRAMNSDPYKSKILLIDGKEFEVVPPKYKAGGKTSDYFQLKETTTESMYHLKAMGLEHRGFQHRYPYIYMQSLGASIARYFNLATQESSIVRLNNEDFLLTKDIRGEGYIKSMEPLSYFSTRVIDSSRKLNELFEQWQKYSKTNVSEFMTKMVLFDTLIANNQRDARSLRIFEVDKSAFIQNPHLKMKSNHDFLIETNFGCAEFSEKDKRPLYTNDELFEFIIANDSVEAAKSFFNGMSPKNLRGIIEKTNFLSPEMKESCLNVLNTQYESLLYLEERILEF